jgi:sortase A
MQLGARRLAGGALVVAGAALLLGAGGTYARGAIAQDRLRAEWDAAQARRAVREVNRSLDARQDPVLVAGAPVARLRIPRIGLDEIVVEGVADAQLNAGPGHLPKSAIPGDSGNAVVSAHRDRHFHSLDALAVGDTVITESLHGAARWVIDRRHIVERGEPALFASREPRLTLTTCWPVRYVGPAPDRLILEARLLQGAAN